MTERVLRWARMQSPDLHAAPAAALKAGDALVAHDCAGESIYIWAHLEDRLKDSEVAGIVKLVRNDDGVDAFR